MRIFHVLFNIFSWIAIGAIAMVVLYLVSSNYNVFFGYKSFLVLSGSMEPAIMTGDIIVSRAQPIYAINDVVTFRNTDNRIVTHRITEIAKKTAGAEYSTKGDANRSEDFDTITFGQIIGKVVFIVPKFGYLVSFSKSLPGIAILIFIPGILFIADELVKMRNA